MKKSGKDKYKDKDKYAIQITTLGCFGTWDMPSKAQEWADRHLIGDWHILIIKEPPGRKIEG